MKEFVRPRHIWLYHPDVSRGETLSLTNLVSNKAPQDAYYKCSLIHAAAAMQSPVWRGIRMQEPSSFVHNQLSDKRDVDCTTGEKGSRKGGKETMEGWEFKGIYPTASQNWTNPADMRQARGLCTHCSHKNLSKPDYSLENIPAPSQI